MIENALEFIKEHEPVIKDTTKYLKDVDWTNILERKDRINEHKLHLKLVNSLTDKLEHVVTEAGEDNLKKDVKIKNFVESVIKEVKNYTKRTSDYFRKERWQDYPDQEDKSAELDFQDTILKEMLKIKKRVSSLKLDEEKKEIYVKVYADAILSLPMRQVIEERYPNVKEYMEKKLGK
jgi:ElaB/YqjD/DUF883 family membrane-anchored ribosome-binding protein